MLRILDRYLLLNFLFSFVLFLVIILALLTVVYVVSDLDEIREAVERAGEGATVAGMVARVSLYRLPVLFYHFSPFITLMSAMFAVARLQKNNELVPMQAAGLSAYRIFLPFLVWSGIVTVVAMIDQQYIIPRVALTLRQEEGAIDDPQDYKSNPYLTDSYKNYWSARRLAIKKGKLDLPVFDAERLADGRVKLVAKTAQWVPESPAGAYWDLRDVQCFVYSASGSLKPYMEVVDKTLRPHDSKHLDAARVYYVPYVKADLPAGTVDHLVTDLRPESMTAVSRSNLQPEFLSFGELTDNLRRGVGDIRGQIMQRHLRLAHPLANILLLLMGLPLAINRERKNLAAGILMAVGLCILYESVSMLCQSTVYSDFTTPQVYAWLPAALFAPVAAYLYDSMKT